MSTGSSHLEPTLFAWAVVIAVTLFAAVIDVRSRKISNRITGPLLLGGLIWSTYVGGISGFGWSLLSTFLIGLPFFLLWLQTGGSGAADAKMMGAVASWLGLSAGVEVLLAVAIAGGVLSLASAIARGNLVATLLNTLGLSTVWMVQLFTNPASIVQCRSTPAQSASAKVPYGVAICAGVCAIASWRYLWVH